MATYQKINSLINQLIKIKLNSLEEIGVSNDLSLILTKIQKQEYQKGFFPKNKFDVVNRTLEIVNELEFYGEIGRTWAQIFKTIDINSYSKIVDLCPGYIPKIELGLYYVGFHGTLTILDLNEESLKRLTDFLSVFNPQFTIKSQIADLSKKAIAQYDLVLANHIVDDLVISHFASVKGISLESLYNEEGLMVNLWREILQHQEINLKTMVSEISGMLDRIIAPGGTLIVSHYVSYMDKLLDLNPAIVFNQILLKKVISNLCQHQYSQQEGVIQNALENYRGIFGVKDCYLIQKDK